MKPCPFCGSNPVYDKDVKMWQCGDDKDNCPIVSILMTKEEWNTRINPIQKQLEDSGHM